MKALKIREHTSEELNQLYNDSVKDLLEIRVKKGMGGDPEQPLRIRTLRRDIARIRTVMREKEENHG